MLCWDCSRVYDPLGQIPGPQAWEDGLGPLFPIAFPMKTDWEEVKLTELRMAPGLRQHPILLERFCQRLPHQLSREDGAAVLETSLPMVKLISLHLWERKAV